jgi:hypothetical protein
MPVLRILLYSDCGNSPVKLTIEALPVTPQAQYTMWLFETSIKLGNSTIAMTSGESNTLGNGEGLFNVEFTVPSKDKICTWLHFIVVTTLAHHQ